jgi:exosortase
VERSDALRSRTRIVCNERIQRASVDVRRSLSTPGSRPNCDSWPGTSTDWLVVRAPDESGSERGRRMSAVLPEMPLLTRHTLFGAYCLALATTNGAVLRSLLEYSRQDASASHVVLIPVISTALVYQSRQIVFSSVRASFVAGGCLGIFGIALRLAADVLRSAGHASWLSLAIAALVTLLIAGFLLFYGYRASRAALFPLLFLGFTVPVPAVLVSAAAAFLKSVSTEIVSALFALTETPYVREGYVFSLPRLTIEIGDECSGIRSTIGLLLTGLLVGHVFLRRMWAKAALLSTILPIAVFKNAVRIVTLSLLSLHVDRGFIDGRLHHQGGLAFFALALVMLAPVVALLIKTENALIEVNRKLDIN